MKKLNNKIQKTGSSLLLFITALIFMTASKLEAQSVDLQAVSIDPTIPSLGIGQTGSIVVSMKNNGPGIIPIGEATASVTLSSVYLDLGTPLTFIDACSQWVYLGNVPGAGTFNLFFQNNAGAIPVGGAPCNFRFNVKGKLATPAPSGITLSSSLAPGATTSDINGTNQSATTEISVTGAADLTAGQFFNTLHLLPGGTIDEVVSIRNVGITATTGQVEFTITTYAALTGINIALIPGATATLGFSIFTLDNANWTFNSGTGTFTSNPGVFINPGALNTRNLGIRITRPVAPNQGANGGINHTVTITNGTGGGETPTNNNSISNILVKY